MSNRSLALNIKSLPTNSLASQNRKGAAPCAPSWRARRGQHETSHGEAAATAEDLPAVTALYNRFVVKTAVNFDTEPFTPAQRREWFSQFGATGRYRIMAGFWDGGFAGYAASMRHKVKRGYDTTVETTIYVDPDFDGRGVGKALYKALMESLAGEDIRSMVAGVALPNEASIKLHKAFGFREVGTFHTVGRKFGRFHDVMWLERLV